MALYLDHAELQDVAGDFTGDISITITPYQWALLIAVVARLGERWRWLDAGVPVDDTTSDLVEEITADLQERLMGAYP